ncbi:hypothetical protein J1N35_010604, partial [Gossypium stocksii]
TSPTSSSSPTNLGHSNSNVQQKAPVKTLSQAKMENRRKKGICFWCATKYTLWHKCAKSSLYQLLIESNPKQEGDSKSPTSEEFLDCNEQLKAFEYLGQHQILQCIVLGSMHLISTSQLSKCFNMDLQDQPHSHPKYSWDGRVLRRKGKIVVGNQLEQKKAIFNLFLWIGD